MRKLKVIPWILGVGLVVTTAAGANYLLHANQASAGAAPPAAVKPSTPSGNDGLVAKGTVMSDPPVVPYSLPAHLAAGTIAAVPVQNGTVVKAGDTLLVYDTALLKRDHEKAVATYNTAAQEWERVLAERAKLVTARELAELAVKDAEQAKKRAVENLSIAKSVITKELNIKNLTKEQVDEGIREDPRIFTANSTLDKAETNLKKCILEVEAVDKEAEAVDRRAKVAAYNAEAIKADAAKAQQAIDDCTIKAKSPGTVEQVTAAVGQTITAASRQPLLYFVPTGKLVVWAEIVPEFSDKIKNRIGQKVSITDDSNTLLTYEGVVKHISNAFLQKPNGTPEIVNGKTNLVLILEVEVIDATPAGKSPLRVGQPVRVVFP